MAYVQNHLARRIDLCTAPRQEHRIVPDEQRLCSRRFHHGAAERILR